jgi:glycosyltransferase involved in cell wall biosynthesis
MRHFLFVPGSLETATGGYEYDRRIVAGLRDQGLRIDVRELDGDFPCPSAAARADAARALAGTEDGAVVLFDGLAFGALPDEVSVERDRLRLIALVHHPLALETGLDLDAARALDRSERVALQAARLVVVTSRATAVTLGGLGVSAGHIAVVEPGVDRAPLAKGSTTGVTRFLSVGAVSPRKGYDVLVRALSRIADRPWQARIVGSTSRHRTSVEQLERLVADLGLSDRVTLAGEVTADALAAEYSAADVFVLPTYYEGFGMAVAQAIAYGLPCIATSTGAIPSLLRIANDAGGEGDGAAGVLVGAGDWQALSGLLARMIDDGTWRGRLRAGARAARHDLRGWADVAREMADVIDRVANDRILA